MRIKSILTGLFLGALAFGCSDKITNSEIKKVNPTADVLQHWVRLTVQFDDSFSVLTGTIHFNRPLVGAKVTGTPGGGCPTQTVTTDVNGKATFDVIECAVPVTNIAVELNSTRVRAARAHTYGDFNSEADTALFIASLSKDSTAHVVVGYNNGATIWTMMREDIPRVDSAFTSTYKVPQQVKFLYNYQSSGCGGGLGYTIICANLTGLSYNALFAVMHEYGHVLHANVFGMPAGAVSPHSWCGRTDLVTGWVEGFADFIGTMSTGWRKTGTSGNNWNVQDDYDLEQANCRWGHEQVPGYHVGGLVDEGAVSAYLYDIYDSDMLNGINNTADGEDDTLSTPYASRTLAIADVMKNCQFNNAPINGVDEFIYCMQGNTGEYSLCTNPNTPPSCPAEPYADFRQGLTVTFFPTYWPALNNTTTSGRRIWKWDFMGVQ